MVTHGAAGDRAAGAGAARPARSRRRTRGRPAARWSPAPRRSARPPTTPRSTRPSQRAAINWQSFDVGSQQSVTFNQPSSSAVTLNRVTGPDPSQIAGRINANGQVVLVNQSGVMFYKGAQVNTDGLMVSRRRHHQPELHGRQAWSFDQPAQSQRAVDNHGNITVKQAGLAALVAPQVANSGTITAQARPRRAGGREDRDARSVRRRAAVARRHQPGHAGAGRARTASR